MVAAKFAKPLPAAVRTIVACPNDRFQAWDIPLKVVDKREFGRVRASAPESWFPIEISFFRVGFPGGCGIVLGMNLNCEGFRYEVFNREDLT
jgi:hypothetical protein